ncbi:TauD-domain-containing protein [Cylindrobasidium torrendii FP15055 ss-10]|uniref:TauD-domain-containing protein n=1 Tax=Cylindrobasidium torrendii FP15055 ss-10 TaxID=1314674 RepID=A0A0D7B8R6_9AGAR|nr:TauD-domain-containing protein [Cylindrobasidium torrendii FP15055 ss-10]
MPPTATVTETEQPRTSVLPLRQFSAETPNVEKEYKYKHLLPVFSPASNPPLVPFEHVDPGHRALKHADPRSFLANATTVEITPALGTEIRGVDLTKLDSTGRDQVALETARRGLLVFRDQEAFIDSPPSTYLEWGQYFGRLHVHPTSGHPEGIPELHLVYKDANKTFNFEFSDSTTSTLWHSDVSYELQPPGLTTLFLLDSPSTGGDTLFVSQVQALNKLSPGFVAFLRTLKAVHSGVEQANHSRNGRRGGIVRREPVENVHPIVRRHPVTGEEALYVNKQFTRRIIGFKREESDTILNFLYDHIARSGDIQARIKWAKNTVVLWDNRVTAHTAIVDYAKGAERRHGARITPQAERPIPALEGLDLSA